ncbi:MAG: hypothetical protein RI826_09635, partial [Chlorobium phaeovibrioides]|nr:hypothetical protein [Chlorobium phaeovibrioides]
FKGFSQFNQLSYFWGAFQWYRICKFDPSVIPVEFASERQVKGFERELMKLGLIHKTMISRCKVFDDFLWFSLHEIYENMPLFHYYKITY